MTTSRYIYVPNTNKVGVILKKVEFDWFPGFSIIQKQKSISSLHANADKIGIKPILEISSKSPELLGQQLSAFNMYFTTKKLKNKISVESAFQGSKVFDHDGPFTDLYQKSPLEAKKDERLKNSGNIIGFNFFGEKFDSKPRTFFYDWLYINALKQHDDLLEQILNYNGFSDIEFNPEKSINCQAYSVALAVSLLKNGVFESISNKDNFKNILAQEYNEQDAKRKIQQKMF